MHCEKAPRKIALTLVALIPLTFAGSAHATFAKRKIVTYNLSPGTNSQPITPIANKPVLVIGVQTNTGDVGSGEMTVVNSVGADNELVWSGLESNAGGATAGFSTVPGHHIVFIDFAHCVDLQVASATSFVVHNGCSFAVAGSVSMFH